MVRSAFAKSENRLPRHARKIARISSPPDSTPFINSPASTGHTLQAMKTFSASIPLRFLPRHGPGRTMSLPLIMTLHLADHVKQKPGMAPKASPLAA
jgi:hypothetical protein